MTDQTPETVPAPVVVLPPAESRLADLHASYADAKARADEAAAQLKVITDAIKAELQTTVPDATRVELRSQNGPALSLNYVESWRLDSKRLKAEHTELWVRYAKKSGSWTLRALTGGNDE